MSHEVWKDIKGLEGRYQVSDHGRVRSLDRETPVNGGIRFSKGRMLNTRLDRYGYSKISFTLGKGKKRHSTIHRLVASAFIPNPNNLPQVNHKDGDKTNNHVNNLEWCTGEHNIKHAKDMGLIHGVKGGKHYKSKPIIDLSTGIYYECTKEASEAIGINQSTLKDYLGRYSHRNKTSLRYAKTVV